MKNQLNQQPGFIRIDATGTDTRFPSFLQGFNRRWFAPGCKAIYLCFTAEGAALALDEAISFFGQSVKIKSGGHCYEDFVFNGSTGAILDVTPMGDYGYDEERGYYLESGGTNWTAFQALFRDYGKVLPAGSCYSVGLGGHICGGGYGLLSRLNGLTVDWLTGVEVVVKDNASQSAYPIYVSVDSTDPDEQNLYWSHRGGGGGNFGVITKYYFKTLPDAPAKATVSTVAYPWDTLTEENLYNLLETYADFSANADGRQFGLFAMNHLAAGEMHLTVQTAILQNESPELIRANHHIPVMEKFRAAAPSRAMTRPGIAHLSNLFPGGAVPVEYTFYEAVQTLNPSGANQRGKYKSAYMRKAFPPDQVSAIYKWLTAIPPGLSLSDMAQSLLQADTYGGMINTIASDATAVPQRSSIMKLQYQTYWTNAAQDTAHLEWMSGFYADVYKYSGGTPDPAQDPTDNVDGCYYNYPDIELNGPNNDKEIALRLYFNGNLPRLKATKQRWDPNNYFNSAQSI